MIHLIPTKDVDLIWTLSGIEILDIDLKHDWLVIKEEYKLIGIFEINPLTKISGLLHLNILEEYQNQGIAIKAFNALIKYLKTTNYKQIIGSIPEKNKKIMSIVNKTKGKCCGSIKDGIIFNNELQDLLLFQLEVNS